MESAIAELVRLEALLPVIPSAPARQEPRKPETTDAEKVGRKLSDIRENVRTALLSSWALDDAYEKAVETVEAEHRNFSGSDRRVKEMEGDLYLKMGSALAIGLAVGLFFLLIGDWTQKASTEILDYWSELYRDFSASPGEVYQLIEEAVKKRAFPGLECTREFWHEGGAVSAKREYLRFSRERLCFEICAAPFGSDYFLSYRESRVPLTVDPLGIIVLILLLGGALLALAQSFGLMWGGIILVIAVCLLTFLLRTAVLRALGDLDRTLVRTPLLGPLYELFLRPITYYRIDSENMYRKGVQGVVMETIQTVIGSDRIQMVPEAGGTAEA